MVSECLKNQVSTRGARNLIPTIFFTCVMLLQATFAAADCTVSKEFRLKHAQVLAGSLQDPNGGSLPGVGLELVSGRTVIRDLRTNSKGAYDFGEVPSGKYRLRIHYGDDTFCAPRVRCGKSGCAFDSKVRLNSKNSITVY